PSSVSAALVLEDLESWLEPSVVCESKLCDHVKPHQNVVVDVIRIVESEPRDVLSPFLEQSSFQVELSSSRNGPLNLPGSFRLWQSGKGGQGLPAVQRSRRALGTVPTPIFPLVFEEPIIQLLHPVVVAVAESTFDSEPTAGLLRATSRLVVYPGCRALGCLPSAWW